MNWLEDITFRATDAGGLEAVLPDGTRASPVRLVQLFPLRRPKRFISVIRPKAGEEQKEELGVLKDLKALPDDQQRLVEEELHRSFFLPEIQTIEKIDTTGGVDEWHVQTDRGDKVLYICDRKQSIHVCDDGMVFVTDSDKCRYRIRNPEKLDALSQHLLERAMP